MAEQILPDEQRCVKKARHSGLRCKNRRVPGLEVCHFHGGGSPKAKEAGRKRLAIAKAEEDARKAVELFGGKRDISPDEALLELVQRKAAEVEYWRARVAKVKERKLLAGDVKRVTSVDKDETTWEAREHVALAQLHQAERDLMKMAVAAKNAGVQEARIRLAEAQAGLMFQVLTAIFADARRTTDSIDVWQAMVDEAIRPLAIEA